jgi:hypothetical protein
VSLSFSIQRHNRKRGLWYPGHTTQTIGDTHHYQQYLPLGISHYLSCDRVYVNISVSVLNTNSICEQCFAKMDVCTFKKWQTCISFMSMHMATAGRPGTSISKVFSDNNFHIGKHLSTLIVAYDRQEHFNLLLQTEGDHYPSKHIIYRGGYPAPH